MTLKKFLDDHLPFLPHGSWKKGAEALEKDPANFTSKRGWPEIKSKVKDFERLLEAWGYEVVIIQRGGEVLPPSDPTKGEVVVVEHKKTRDEDPGT